MDTFDELRRRILERRVPLASARDLRRLVCYCEQLRQQRMTLARLALAAEGGSGPVGELDFDQPLNLAAAYAVRDAVLSGNEPGWQEIPVEIVGDLPDDAWCEGNTWAEDGA
jgi:hypothetical protein